MCCVLVASGPVLRLFKRVAVRTQRRITKTVYTGERGSWDHPPPFLALALLKPRLFFLRKPNASTCGRYLDAKRKGGIARFVNHSCDPTCRLEQWTAMGLPRCAVFSLRGMEAGEVRDLGLI